MCILKLNLDDLLENRILNGICIFKIQQNLKIDFFISHGLIFHALLFGRKPGIIILLK